MKNILIFVVLLLSSVSQANVKISVEYSESANYFDMMDNVSNWWDGFTDIEYSKEWIKRFGAFSPEDLKMFETYGAIRQNYYHDPDQKEKDPSKNRNGFFAINKYVG